MGDLNPRYLGLLGHVTEAIDIAAERGVSFEKARKIQRRRAQKREPLPEPDNVIRFDFKLRKRL